MHGFRSRRTVFERAVLTVIAACALILQGLWSGVVPLRMASFDPLGDLCSIDRPDGGAPSPQAPGDRQADRCCALLCRTALAGSASAILPAGPALRVPNTIAGFAIAPTASPDLRAPPKGGGGARAPPVPA